MVKGERVLINGDLLVCICLWFMGVTIKMCQHRDLEQKNSLSLQDVSLPIQLRTFLGTLSVNKKGTYHQQQKKNIIKEHPLCVKVDDWCIESQHGNVFSHSYIYCLYESIMELVNKYNWPGFMFVPHKLWPFRNEWHTI